MYVRLPVLVKSVFKAPVPEYEILTASALSAQRFWKIDNKDLLDKVKSITNILEEIMV